MLEHMTPGQVLLRLLTLVRDCPCHPNRHACRVCWRLLDIILDILQSLHRAHARHAPPRKEHP